MSGTQKSLVNANDALVRFFCFPEEIVSIMSRTLSDFSGALTSPIVLLPPSVSSTSLVLKWKFSEWKKNNHGNKMEVEIERWDPSAKEYFLVSQVWGEKIGRRERKKGGWM